MKALISIKPSTWLFLIGLVVVCTSPVWGVAYFVNQDGPGHVQSSYLMAEIIRGNPVIANTFVLSPFCIPNSSTHLVLALLLQVFSAFTATKIVVCALFAGTVAAIGWLRLATVGPDGLKTSLLIGALIGFNWLWLVGNYNFICSIIILAITLGVFWKWRERLDVVKTVALTLLLAASYYSHIFGFAVLAGSIVVLALSLPRDLRYKALVRTLPCFLPFLPLAIWYWSISEDGSPAMPIWRSLADPYSLASWLKQMSSADAFLLISRTAFPFVEARTKWFVIFSVSLWMVVALCILIYATIRRLALSRYLSSKYFPFAFFLLGSAIIVLFAPDDFGVNRGGLIRERIVICSLLFFVPLYRTAGRPMLKRTAQIILMLVILFQTAAVWDYAMRADRSAVEYVAARPAMGGLRSIATVSVYTEHPRFHSTPEIQLNLFNSIENNMIAWDNYEFGHFLFPVRTRTTADKDFAYKLITSNVFYTDDPAPAFAEKLTQLDTAFASDEGRVDALLVWGGAADVDAIISKYFESVPYYQSENLRLFRRRR